jgi:RNase adaptor protein for sRNA GlmZ degradation
MIMTSKPRMILYTYSLKDPYTSNGINYEIDVSQFRDPLGNKALTTAHTDGRHKNVQAWVAEDPRFDAVLDSVLSMADDANTTNMTHLCIGFADHHGKWAAVALAELAAQYLRKESYDVAIYHRVAGR